MTVRLLTLGMAWSLSAGALALPPLGPAVNEALKPKEPPKIETKPQAADDKILIRSAGQVQYEKEIVKLSGGADFRYREYDIIADRAEGNTKTEIFRLFGKVRVLGDQIDYDGGDVEVDFNTKSLRFVGAKTTLGPKNLEGGFQDSLYVRAGGGFGTRQTYRLTDTSASTCSLDDPHWELTAKQVVVRPGRAISMKHARLEILGGTVIQIPYLNLPLDRDLPRYLPTVGVSPDEGYFIKTRYGIDTGSENLLDAQLDLMSKRGIGLGADLDYTAKDLKGKLLLYQVLGAIPTKTANLTHQQTFGKFRLNSSLNYGERNYLTAPRNTTLSTRHSIGFLGVARFDVNYNSNESSSFKSENHNLALSAQPRIDGWQNSLDLNLVSSSSRSTSGSTFRNDRRALDIRFRTSKELGAIRTEMIYNRQVPISEIQGFFSPSDQTPVLTLTSDSKRLKLLPVRLPLMFSVGELIDPTRRRPVTRLQFETSLPNTQWKTGRLKGSYGGRFRQNVYSDDTAQFVGAYDTSAGYEFAPGTSINARYGYLRPQGFSPLSIDRSGRTDYANMDLNLRVGKRFNAAITSGYDFQDLPGSRTPWQSVGFRADYKSGKELEIRAFTSYDPLNQVWSTARGDFVAKAFGASFRGSIRYDGSRHTFGAASLVAEGLKWGKLSTSFLLSYNGYTKRFESRQAAFTYDMHCTELIINVIDNQTGFRNGTTYGIYIRLKALPFSVPFGVGPRGQGFGGTGGIRY